MQENKNNEKIGKAKTVRVRPEVQKENKNAAVYSTEKLKAVSREVFGVKPEVLEGALHFVYENKKAAYTRAETENAVKRFKNKEVK